MASSLSAPRSVDQAWLNEGQLSSDATTPTPKSLAPGRKTEIVSLLKTSVWATPGFVAIAQALNYGKNLQTTIGYSFGLAAAIAYLLPHHKLAQEMLGTTGLTFAIGWFGARSLNIYHNRAFVIATGLSLLSAAGIFSVSGLLFNTGRSVSMSERLPSYDATTSVRA
jgi:hypothetical protein